jgi:hypothetical protein
MDKYATKSLRSSFYDYKVMIQSENLDITPDFGRRTKVWIYSKRANSFWVVTNHLSNMALINNAKMKYDASKILNPHHHILSAIHSRIENFVFEENNK